MWRRDRLTKRQLIDECFGKLHGPGRFVFLPVVKSGGAAVDADLFADVTVFIDDAFDEDLVTSIFLLRSTDPD